MRYVEWVLSLGMEKQKTLDFLKKYDIHIKFATNPLPDELWKKLYMKETLDA